MKQNSPILAYNNDIIKIMLLCVEITKIPIHVNENLLNEFYNLDTKYK